MLVWPAVFVAFASSGVYWVGVALFKVAADRMPPLRGDRPAELLARMLAEPRWLVGAGVVLLGLVLQGLALHTLAIPQAQPVFLASLTVWLGIAVGWFAERLAAREWTAAALVAAGTAMLAATAPGGHPPPAVPPPPALLALVVPLCLVLPVAVFLACERPGGGLHARPPAGTALGVTAGLLIGTAEIALAGMTRLHQGPAALAGTVYPYLFVVAAGLGVAQLQTALQRHRMVTIGFAATVVAKVHLLVTGGVLFGPAWPHGRALPLLLGGVAAALLAVAVLPRHPADPGRCRPRGRPDVSPSRGPAESGRAPGPADPGRR
ncbi:hypothetical protein [Actinomadura parmotrematis]|uniref:Uncharacterized protein n=1 Tax=Actinomadura parmotrematis TaxID=2864039 RepID=A0ABS7G6B1_9ACTN|nr:hypothetical protein [Actinomadura parmotrematis]MBW8487347.1 hypothetical protein [Actinomadura parmotrematis]